MIQTPLDLDQVELKQLSDQVGRIAQSLAHLSSRSESSPRNDPQKTEPLPSAGFEDTVRWLVKARRQRARFLPSEMFAEPAWDMLLDLFLAEVTQRRVSVSSVCAASGVPTTTALRYIKNMVDQGMIVRRQDPYDGRRVFVELSPEISQGLRQYFVEVVQSRRAA